MAVSSRYARAFIELVFEQKADARQVGAQLQTLVALVASNDHLRDIWENPSIPVEQKRAVLDEIAARSAFSPLLRNFAAVILDHDRMPFLPEIVEQYEEELDRRMGLAEADVTSARELGAEERTRIETRMSSLTGKSVRASYKTDAGLLGGAVIRIGSTVYDGSVRGRLEKLKEQLMAG